MPRQEPVEVRTPSTVGNFGPGFDVTALGLAWGGDVVRLTPSDADRVTVTGAGADTIPAGWRGNCATAALDHLRDVVGVEQRYDVMVEKGVAPGSGLGSSASSSAGGALALARALRDEHEFTPRLLVEAAAAGEAVVAGAHADDVAAAVLGGLAMVRGDGEVQRVQPPKGMWVALAVPRLRLETRVMRRAVGERVRVEDAVANLANVAFLVDAFHRGDVETVGRCLTDRMAVPGRKRYVPYHDDVVDAALEAGAYGAALSGSGPSMFAVTDDEVRAGRVARAMRDAVTDAGVEAEAVACQAETRVVMDEVLLR